MTYDSIKAFLVDHNGKLSPVNGMLGKPVVLMCIRTGELSM